MADGDKQKVLVLAKDPDGVNIALTADADGRLITTAEVTVGEVEIKNDSGNPVPISAASLPLPTGAATATGQSTNQPRTIYGTDDSAVPRAITSHLLSEAIDGDDRALVVQSVIHGKTTSGGGSFVDDKVSPSGAVQVGGTLDGITALPLPTGAATATGQSTNQPRTMYGLNDSGAAQAASVNGQGHLEVEVHGPRFPFGSLHVEEATPVFQTDAVYGLNAGQVNSGASGSGTAAASNSLFTVSTGTTVGSFAEIQSRKRLRYRAGQGVMARFAGFFTAPVASSYQVAGLGHAEDGAFFGYKGTAFGILHNSRGVRELRTLTVTTGATSSGNVTITLNTVAFTVAVTNASNIQRTVWEISQGTFAGWKAQAVGATVLFLSDSVGAYAGTFSFNAGTTGAAASIALTRAGAAVTETFVAQTAWNGDKLDGTGASGVTANWARGNVFQIGIQYLGFGALIFSVEVTPATSNNPTFIPVHVLKLPNTLTATSFGNPSFPFTMAAYSAGSTTNLSVNIGSFAGFIEGRKVLHGNRFTYTATSTTVSAAAFVPLFSIAAGTVYGGRSSQAVVNLLSIAAANKHTAPVTLYIIRNGALAGNPSFTAYDTQSVTLYDTAATAVTFTNNNQIIFSLPMADSASGVFAFTDDITLQPGEWVTVAARAATGTPAYVIATLNTREDQ